MSVSQIIGALAPAYAGDGRIAILLPLAMQQTSRLHFGANYELAVALRVCHMIARNPAPTPELPQPGPGTPGAVSSKSEGELSVSYQVSHDLQRKYGDLCSTPYGAQLADLIEGNVLGHLVPANAGALTDSQGDNI